MNDLPLASDLLERSLAKAHVLKSSRPADAADAADASALDMERTGVSFVQLPTLFSGQTPCRGVKDVKEQFGTTVPVFFGLDRATANGQMFNFYQLLMQRTIPSHLLKLAGSDEEFVNLFHHKSTSCWLSFFQV